MAAPNIVNVTSIIAQTAVANVTTTGANLVSNGTSTNQVYKINTLYISNVDGVSSADIIVRLDRPGVKGFAIANTIAVPADATLVVIDKSSGVYLEEGDAIFVQASANGDLVAVASFEVIS